MRKSSIQLLAAAAFSLVGLAGAASADDLNREVEIVNQTGYTIVSFYGSHTDTNSWQEDVFGEDVLPSGNSVVVDFDDDTGYCIFDLRAEFEDGEVLEQFGVDVCEIDTVTFN